MTPEENEVIRAALAWRGQWKMRKGFNLQKYNEAQRRLLKATLILKRVRRLMAKQRRSQTVEQPQERGQRRQVR
jgi:hypothetical protein